MNANKIQASIDAIKDDLARAIERGDRGQAAACRTNLAAFAAMRKRAAAPRPLWLVTVTRKDGAWAVFKDGKRISTNFERGRDALNHAIGQGWQAGYRGLTYNDGGYLNGVRAEAA